MSEEKSLTIPQATEVQSTGLDVLGVRKDLEARMEKYNTIRDVVVDYIDQNFIKDIDFGPADPRNPKPTLLKPGAEKVCRLFATSPQWEPDFDTWKMLGEPKDVICYKCKIVDNATGRVVGEGRGAERVGNKQRDHNKAIKNAEKCALVDACLYTFMLSEKFTQDDGGKTTLAELKRQLLEDITAARAGVESKLSDVEWLHEVLKSELHKTAITTIKEQAHMRKNLFEDKGYDLATGKKLNA